MCWIRAIAEMGTEREWKDLAIMPEVADEAQGERAAGDGDKLDVARDT